MAVGVAVLLMTSVLFIGGCSRAGDEDLTLEGGAPGENAAEGEGGVSESKTGKDQTAADTSPATNSMGTRLETEQWKKVKLGPNDTGVIVTKKGTIEFKMFIKDAKNTVANFELLAGKDFYNGTKFHRVEPGFVIQGGDPKSKDGDPANDGTGDPGYAIPLETSSRKHVLGAVAMARSSDPDSAGSQFYITLAPTPFLDGQYAVFGQVTKGIDVVKKIKKGDVMVKVYIKR